MKVVLVLQKLVGLRGGAERVVIQLARELERRGHAVQVATFEPGVGAAGYDLEPVETIDLFPPVLRRARSALARGGRAESAESAVANRWNQRGLAHAKWQLTHGIFARRLRRFVLSGQPDVVVGFMPPAISAVAFAGQHLPVENRPRLVASTHNVPSLDFGESDRWDQNPIARERNLWALGAVDAVTVLNESFVSQLPEQARRLALVMPNAVRRVSPPKGIEREPLIIGVGRLTPVKRFDVLIESFARVAQAAPQWRLEIYGDGPERARLCRLIRERGIEHCAQVKPATSEIGAVYDRARILVHPAAFEGFGLVVAEAIIHGTSVIASAGCPGVNELIENGSSGALIDETKDLIDAFTTALQEQIQTPLQVDRQAAAAGRLAARLDPASVYDRWEELLEERR